jgi:dTDP-4-amino-4,6-dideoxygalactose transaminase
MIRVPLLDLNAQYEPIRDSVLAAITRVCNSQRFIGGEEVEALERELSRVLGVGHLIGVSSGTDALLAALMALGVGPGHEVITSAYSFFSTAGCIARLGARPVFVDIDPSTFNIDTRAVDAVCTSATRAIIPVHLFGLVADMDPILEIGRRRGIAVVEDAAQAIGARRNGLAAGSFGELGCLSFFPSKNLGAFGDGGAVMTNDAILANKVRILRNHGSEPKYFHKIVGGNFRLDALQAAVLRVKAEHLASWTEGRRRNADRYRRLMTAAGLDRHIQMPVETSNCFHIYNQFVVTVKSGRDKLRAHLSANGVGTEVYYPVPLHLQECFSSLGYHEGQFPAAEAAARESLAIPIYSELTDEQLHYVVDSLAEFFETAEPQADGGVPSRSRPAER